MKGRTMRINVKHEDLGFFTEKPIPVVKREDGNIIWCNHAAAETDTDELHYMSFSGLSCRKVQYRYCPTCGATQDSHQEMEWQNAPMEGALWT
jgi:hypothetical protein